MSRQRRTIWNSVGYWLAEIVVVFIGVYLAFLLNGYRTHRQNEHKKQQIYEALYHYFSEMNIKRSKKQFDNEYVKPFLKPYRKKEMPRLKKSPRIVTFSINDHTWNAMLQAGGIDLLDVNLIMQINYFFVSVQRFDQMIDHYNRMSDKYLLSHYNNNISTFYDTKTKKLKPRYQWYMNYITFSENIQSYMIKEVNGILKTLKQKMNKKQLHELKADSTS